MPTADIVARAFDPGRPTGELVHVRRGDADTWRLETTDGRYLVKGYWPTTGGQFTDGELPDQLEVAMAFERRALEVGIDMPEPIPPGDPFVGWATRVNGRLLRVHRWIEGRELRPDDDIADWLGRTMAQVHRIDPLGPPTRPGLPDWWRAPVHPRTTWEEWTAEAARRDRAWSESLRDRLPAILEISARLEELCKVAPDCVRTHGDFKTHNLVVAPTGPVLVDWDTVRVDSAALEAGRVALIFGAFGGGGHEPTRRILNAYVEAGGDLAWTGRDPFLSEARHDLHGLFERILVSLGRRPAARWMGDDRAIEDAIADLLRDLPAKIERTDQFASRLADLGR